MYTTKIEIKGITYIYRECEDTESVIDALLDAIQMTRQEKYKSELTSENIVDLQNAT